MILHPQLNVCEMMDHHVIIHRLDTGRYYAIDASGKGIYTVRINGRMMGLFDMLANFRTGETGAFRLELKLQGLFD
jgi:hypothetical protein